MQEQVALHILHKLELQPALRFYEPMRHALRSFMGAVDLACRKMHPGNCQGCRQLLGFPESVTSTPEVRSTPNPGLSPERSSYGMNHTVSM